MPKYVVHLTPDFDNATLPENALQYRVVTLGGRIVKDDLPKHFAEEIRTNAIACGLTYTEACLYAERFVKEHAFEMKRWQAFRATGQLVADNRNQFDTFLSSRR